MLSLEVAPRDQDQQIRASLADSLAYLFDKLDPHIQVSSADIDAALSRIRQNRIVPGVFSRYFDLVFSIDEKKWEKIETLVAEILQLTSVDADYQVLPYTVAALGDDYERYPRLAFASYSDSNPLLDPSETLYRSHQQKIEAAREIIHNVDKSIDEELDALLTHIIVARRNKQTERSFGAVTSLMLWGAVIVNAEAYVTQNQIMDFLVHEITHSVLFAYHSIEPLVLNSPLEKYTSPLRKDSRPMDGVFHATLVSARLVDFAGRCLDHDAVDDEIRNWAETTRSHAAPAFDAGAEVVRKHGQLSDRAWRFIHAAELQVRECS